MDYTVIKLDPALGRRLKAHCAQHGCTMNSFVAELIRVALSNVLRPPASDATAVRQLQQKPSD